MAKTFILHDESLNCFGFWIKSSGLDWSLFDSNPIALFMHIRPGDYQNSGEDMILPIGTWEKRKQDGVNVLADFIADTDDEFACRIDKKIQKGIIRMASLAIEPTKWSEDPADLKPGQKRPTVIAGIVKEASIVDIGGNRNAVRLYNHDGELITLSDDPAKCAVPLINQNKREMKTVFGLLKLADTANEAEAYQAIVKLNEKLTALEADKLKLESEKTKLEGDILKLKQGDETEAKAKREALVDKAITDRKILAKDRENYITLAEKDFDSTKKVLDGMPVMTKLTEQTGEITLGDKYKGKTWKELDRIDGALAEIKLKDMTLFKQLYKEEFGSEPRA